ncbi:HlyD family type I secretion periplasmic adaptor subunit [Halomonas sp. LR5S13]|uniref:HlyD family type I secretion periplasmic adaptor subunit n=1 Tax=Halomonas rhizosphaerae TaxID=3043296 RepID=UPI0024A88A89|nr:HlyD family type I secretion periplasmic adaptor subunit [Halomonas rhizosphaerae]MDI5922934.1 HlyD family type I secretion periplasmic adaptor subunit [Halomonas rhizosphaerae]
MSQDLDGTGVSSPPVDDRWARRFGLLVLLVCLGGVGGWAVTADLAVAVIAPGQLVAASSNKAVKHPTGGVVARVTAAEGDGVAQGEPLVVLETTLLERRLEIARTHLRLALAAEARLAAEREGEARPTFPPALGEAEDPKARRAKEVQLGLFHVRRLAQVKERKALAQQNDRLRERVAGLATQADIGERSLDNLREEVEALGSLYRDGLGDRQRLNELERALLEQQGRVEGYRLERIRLASRIAENVRLTERRREAFREEVGEALHAARRRVADVEERLARLQEQRRRAVITAPVSGSVVGLAVHAAGAVIEPGATLMELVPDTDPLVVEARVADHDIDRVAVGQPAEIRFTAYNRRRTRSIDGRVVRLSADSVRDEGSGRRFYRARVRIDEEEETGESLEAMPLRAGMPAEVRLQAGERTLAGYLIRPLEDTLSRAMRAD